ncbi:hypothetical protein GC173_09680 [bacterium]|nr:hypothetical protein [bacterium]
MRKIARQTSMLALFTGSALLMASAASATIGQAAGLLPGDTDVVLAFSLKSMENSESVMSAVTRAEVEAAATEKLKQEGLAKPYENAAEAGGRVAFTGSTTSTRTDFMAIGLDMDLENPGAEPAVKVVLVGDYGTDTTAALAPLGAKAGSTATTIDFPSATEGKTITGSAPKQELMVFSDDPAWAADVMSTVTAKTNLTAEGSAFNALAATLAGRSPDALVFVPGKLLQGTVGADPQVQAMAAPMLKAEGILVALLPGAEPSVEITASFATAEDATLGKQWADSMLQLLKMQAAGAAAQITDPAQKAQLDEQMAQVNAITVGAADKLMTLKAPIKNLPPKEEIRAQIMDSITNSIEGGTPGAGLMMGPGM